jgi:aflatoxin B1 aldehyde reductase
MSHSTPKIIFGVAGAAKWSAEQMQGFLAVLEKHNVKDLDTAYSYQGSENVLGKAGVPKKFVIHTKAPGFRPGILAKQSILNGMEKSLNELGVSSVETYFLHAPDPVTPIEESLSAISELYAAGKFKHFGLSNFKALDVQKIYDIQESNNSVLPTIFQGNYNPMSRHIESDLFPLLHKLHIAFYAYSPIAGGFLVKSPEILRSGAGEGRFANDGPLGAMYMTLYGKESLYEALEEWGDIAGEAGISKAALAYRWVTFNSALKAGNGDGVILGASKVSQLEESLKAIEEGPLDAKTVARIEDVWKKVEGEAPLDNYHSYMALK